MILESEEERQLIIQLCDMALKNGGMQNLDAVLFLRKCVHQYLEKPKEDRVGSGQGLNLKRDGAEYDRIK